MLPLQKKCLSIFILFCLSFPKAQNGEKGIIKGHVTDTQTEEPLAYVNITIDGTRLGTASNEKGDYVIENVAPGTYRLVLRLIGYKVKIIRRIEVEANQTQTVNAGLEALPLEMDVVSVTADREKEMAEQLAPSIKSIRAGDVESLAGGVEDLFRTIQTLPGVVARSDLSSQFYVRGGSSDQNLIIVDNVPVFNPYRLKVFGGPISMFNPDIIEYIELLPGGFPAEYGDKMSAVLVIDNKEGSRFAHHLKVSTSLIDMKGFAEGPIPAAGENGSWLFSARRTYYDLLFNHLSSLPAGTILPFFRDYQGKIVYDLAPNQKILFNFFDSKEGMKLKDLEVEEGEDNDYFKEEDKFNFTSAINNRLFSLGWINAISDVTLSNLTLSHLKDTWNLTIENINEKYNPEIEMRKMEIKEDLTSNLSTKQTLQGGLILSDYITDITINLDVDSTIYYQDNPDDRQEDDSQRVRRKYRLQNASTNLGFYLQDEWKIVPNIFSVLPGMRTDYSTFTREWVFSPRLSCTYIFLKNMALRGGWGYYYQAPNFVSLFERYDREIEWNLFETISLKTEKSIHYIGAIEWKPFETYNSKFEVYYKDLDQLVTPTDSTRKNIPNNDGTGYAYGFELFFQKKPAANGLFSGWISYSYSVTKEKDPGTAWHYRDFDQRHSVNIVMRYKLLRHFFIDSQYKFASGFPWTPIVKDNQGNPQFDESGEIIKEKLNSDRYPYYQRWDIRITMARKIFDKTDLLFYIEIINVLNRKNVYQYYWSEDYRTLFTSYMLPRMPFFGVKLEL
jgi:outer membrane receptor for ferrienterochelin and colicin